MGKITGFLEYERSDRHYEPVEERIKHWREFVLPLPEEQTKTQAARCMDCGIPYCHTGCPVNNQIPDWNDLVWRGNWAAAARNLHSTNNFPEVTGRVCPAPCEASCTLNLNDNPVTIKTIECMIADRAYAEGWITPQPPASRTGKKVAVVGSGPAGLACAQQLARAGHEVHVFEKLAKPGGLLVYGIPDFKMEKNKLVTWPDWPLKLRTSSSHEEGAERDFAVLTKAFSGAGGRVERLHCVRVDGSIKPIAGTEFELDAGLVLLAMGFVHPVHEGMLASLGVALDARGNVKADTDAYASSLAKVFACGDMRRGQSLVVWAIREGRQCAHAVDKFLMGETTLPR